MVSQRPSRNAPTEGREASPLSSVAIRNHYNEFARAYRLFWGDHLHHGLFRNGRERPREAQEALLRHCAVQAGLRPESHVLDVGCGHGGTARFFAREYSCSVVGLTISEAQLRLARKLSRSLHGAIRFELADAEEYPFPPSSFDLVWNMESFGHFFNKRDYLTKVAATLKPGARFVLADWAGSMQDPLVRQIAESFLCPDLLTAQEYCQGIEAAGMTVVSCETLSRQVSPTWDICAERIRRTGWLLAVLPKRFRVFQKGVELMQEGFRSGRLNYTVLVAERPKS